MRMATGRRRRDGGARPRGAALGAGLCLWLLSAGTDGADLSDWQSIGRAAGLEAWSTQTPAGTVRIGFRNTNAHAVSIRVAETVIWCGGGRSGEGVAVEADLGSFRLRPGESRSSAEWDRTCREPHYYVEFRGMRIEPAE